MKKLICRLFGHRSIVVGLGHDGGCLLCERCGSSKRAKWVSAFSELSFSQVKQK